MDSSPGSLAKQFSIERRFNCVVCLCARFQMVYGRCQHRICTKCAYGSSNKLRRPFQRCPSCQQENAFPDTKPTIPEDNIELQKLLGVMACQNEGCTQEFWSWEKSEHDLTCAYKTSPRREKHHFGDRKRKSMSTPRNGRSKQRRSRDKEYALRSVKSKLDNSGYHLRERHEHLSTR